MVIVGGLIFLTDRVATADDLLVTATVPAPIPTGAPAFTAPDDNTVTDKPSIDFEGTCPIITPAVIIALYDGTTLLGSGLCQNDGTFVVTASITSGAHTIVATVVTITGDTGESSDPLHVTYTPPLVPVNPTNPSSPQNPTTPRPTTGTNVPTNDTIAPLDIISEKPFVTFRSDLKAEWRGRFAGGVPPYTVTIHWGDGKNNTYKVSGNDLQIFTHRYSQNRLYTFSITVQDSSGLTLKRNYVAMQSNGAPTGSGQTHNFTSILDTTFMDPYLSLLIVYLCLLVTMIMMWRYEHIHYPYRVFGVRLRYAWQTSHHSKKHTKKRV